MKGIYLVGIMILLVAITLPLAFSDSASMSVTVGNTAPGVDNIVIAGQDTGASVSPSAGTTTAVSLSVLATDANGWGTISSVICTISGPGTVQDSPVTLSLAMLDSDTATGTGSFNMDFFDATGEYTVNCVAKDASEATGSRSEPFTYTELVGLALDANALSFGNINPGVTTPLAGDTDMVTLNAPTVQNVGNAAIHPYISGVAMNMGAIVIPIGSVEYQFAALGYHALTTAHVDETGLNLVPGLTSTANLDLKLTVPIGTVAGSYSGTLIVGATAI